MAGRERRKGVLYGPAMGLAMAQLIVGEEPELNLSPYAPGRFGYAGAIAALLKEREGMRLDGLAWRELRDAGRR